MNWILHSIVWENVVAKVMSFDALLPFISVRWRLWMRMLVLGEWSATPSRETASRKTQLISRRIRLMTVPLVGNQYPEIIWNNLPEYLPQETALPSHRLPSSGHEMAAMENIPLKTLFPQKLEIPPQYFTIWTQAYFPHPLPPKNVHQNVSPRQTAPS